MTTELDVPTVLGRVRVRADGDGPTMLLWPSLLMDGDSWAGQVAHFRGRYRTLTVDPPGHGTSEALRREFTFDECVRVITAILDAAGAQSCHYLGSSWGGTIGAMLAATAPDRVRSAVLMNCAASPAPIRKRIEYSGLVGLARLLGRIRPPLTGRFIKAFLGPTTIRTRPDVVRAVSATVQHVDIASARWAVSSVVPHRPDQHHLLAGIAVPVLVVAGVEDATVPVAQARVMAERIPGARFELLDGVAHLAALEDPRSVNTLIEDFHATLDAAPSG